MLGTFSFEPYFKSYCLFTFRSLEISEFAKQSIFFHLRTTPLVPAASAVRRPPAALGRLPGHLLVAVASTRHARTPRHLPFRALEASTLAGCLDARHAAPPLPRRR